MSRKRSWNELKALEKYANRRVIEGRGGALTEKANYLATKYADKIANSKSGRRYAARYKAAAVRKDYDERDRIGEVALNRKYSPNTYKGLANG